jgi:hypothetical protein
MRIHREAAMNETNYGKLKADITTQMAQYVDDAAAEFGVRVGMDDELQKALLLLLVRRLTSRGWSIDKLCEDARQAAAPLPSMGWDS